MCGRYNIIDNPETRALLESLGIPLAFSSQYNLAPTDAVPVIVQGENQGNKTPYELHQMRWWLTPSWAPEVSNQYSMFNARAETLSSSRAFKGPYRHHRGLIPASSFIEWKKTGKGPKQPYLIEPENGCFLFAGLWDVWAKQGSYLESCTIVTTEAQQGFRWLHHRMPLILDEDEARAWLDRGTTSRDLEAIRNKQSVENLRLYPLPTDINNSRNKDQSYFVDLEDSIEIKD